MSNLEIFLSAGLLISEGLSLIPFFKSNGIFQMIFNILKQLKK